MELTDASLNGPFALAVGSEGTGLSPEIASASEGLRVATKNVESLNAAISVSIALFETFRQRRHA
jgi:TrmH family RNA methyltransferase